MEINCENGGKLIFEFTGKEFDEINSTLELKSSWYWCKVKFSISKERFKNFEKTLILLLDNKSSELEMMDENGNFSLKMSTDEFSGLVNINGDVCKSMVDEDGLRYNFQAHYESLYLFLAQLQGSKID